MEIKQKALYFKQQLETTINAFNNKRKIYRRKAYRSKVLSACFAALVTVLLGVSPPEPVGAILKNIALVISASLTVLNSIEAFFDHRSLWVGKTITYSRLLQLSNYLNFYLEGLSEDEIDIKIIEKLRTEYDDIMKDELETWTDSRNKSSADKKITM